MGLRYLTIFFLFVLTTANIYPQKIMGKLVDQCNTAMSGLRVDLYTGNKSYTQFSNLDGTFLFEIITNIKDSQLPNGYSISNNYPNPFNPKTRINITLPKESKVKVTLYNILGQVVGSIPEKYYARGNSYIDLNLDGFSNGAYIAEIKIGNLISITKKIMLLYGSQHLSVKSQTLLKTAVPEISYTVIDSVVITGNSVSRFVLKNKVATDILLDLGIITVQNYCCALRCCLNTPGTYTVPEYIDTVTIADSSTCAYTYLKKNVTLSKNFNDIILYSSTYSQDLWPGAIVSSNSIIQGSPNSIITARVPLTINLLSTGIVDNTRVISDPYAGSVEAAINDLLEKNRTSLKGTAVVNTEYAVAHTQDQTAIELGISGLLKQQNISSDFKWDGLGNVNSVFIKHTQRYYTFSIRKFNNYGDYIDTTKVTCCDLSNYLTNNDYPSIINEVTYGRVILLQMINAKTVSIDKMENAFNAVINGNADAELTNIWQNSEIRALILGGSTNQAIYITNPDSIISIIRGGTDFSIENPGAALFYSAQFLTKGLPRFTFGLTTNFPIESFQYKTGDNLWNTYSFGCDFGHDNNFKLLRNGTPVCGSGNCPGSPNSCWGNNKLKGDGTGRIDAGMGQDFQEYGETWLYVANAVTIPNVDFAADVGAVWLNDAEITASPLVLNLKAGWNHLEFTAYNQNDNVVFRITTPLASYVDVMDSKGCP